MPCVKMLFNGRPAFLCMDTDDVFRFEGYKWEMHHYFGPLEMKRDGELIARSKAKFYAAVERWQALPEDEREKYRVERWEDDG